VGKLVLFLADGTLLDVALDKERLTIGRRPDNDVCLPYPAVSGEHAAVVTILADSFLEDLGSTNGTLVNGKAVLKHFLRDHDVIDIGRQRLVYESDNEAKVDPLPPDMLRHQMLGLEEQVAAVRPANTKVATGGGRRSADHRDAPLLEDLDRHVEQVEDPEGAGRLAAGSASVAGLAAAAPGAGVAAGAGVTAGASAGTGAAAGLGVDSATGARPVKSRNASRMSSAQAGADSLPVRGAARAARVDTHAAGPRTRDEAPATGPRLRVVSGPSAGRSVSLVKDQTTVGRAGVQVAAVRKTADGYWLVPLEGAAPPQINGAPVAPEGAALRLGDAIEVAGVRFELSETA
jgi:hypothetical protein